MADYWDEPFNTSSILPPGLGHDLTESLLLQLDELALELQAAGMPQVQLIRLIACTLISD